MEEFVFRYLGSKRGDVILGPCRGEDAAITHANGSMLALSCDPVSGAVKRIGWVAVNVSCNDIATRGVKPRWFLSCIMLPRGSDERIVEEISRQMDRAASKLGVGIVGGHAEVTPGLTHPLIVGFSVGVAEGGRYVTCSGSRPGDKIILTKSAGVEGTGILASDRREFLVRQLGEKLVERAEKFLDMISVVEDALTAFGLGGVHAMHDPTEGGVAGALHEMADASKTGFRVDEEKIRVERETAEICRLFRINPLRLISSGSLLISAEPEMAPRIVNNLRKRGTPADVIGDVLGDRKVRVVVKRDGSTRPLPVPAGDELWTALRRRF